MIKAPVVPKGYEQYNYIDTSTSELIRVLQELHGDHCWYCPLPFVDELDHKYSRTVDHFHSKDYCKKNNYTFEDTHGIMNLTLAHKECNSKKSNREWLDDGTLAPRGRVRPVKAARPDLCDNCMSGRILLLGETCEICGSGPQPAAAPSAYKLTPKECDHTGMNHCWMCWLGLVPRVVGETV